MSPPDSTSQARGVVVHKPKANIYTAMLAISLAAVLLSVLFLVLELSRYDWDFQAKSAGRVSQAAPVRTYFAASTLVHVSDRL